MSKEKFFVLSLQGTAAEKEQKGAEVLAQIRQMDPDASAEIVGNTLRGIFFSTANGALIETLRAEHPMQQFKDQGCLDLCKAGYRPKVKKPRV